MRRIMMALVAGGLLVAAAPVKVPLAPADDKPAQPVGAAARAKNGPEPLAMPPADVGSAEAPVPAVPGQPTVPVKPKG